MNHTVGWKLQMSSTRAVFNIWFWFSYHYPLHLFTVLGRKYKCTNLVYIVHHQTLLRHSSSVIWLAGLAEKRRVLKIEVIFFLSLRENAQTNKNPSLWRRTLKKYTLHVLFFVKFGTKSLWVFFQSAFSVFIDFSYY